MGIEHTDCNPLCGPTARNPLAQRLIEIGNSQRLVRGWERTWIWPDNRQHRHLRRPQTKPKCPQVRFLVVRIESVEGALAVDRRPSWFAPLERLERPVSGRDSRLFKTPCCLFKSHRRPALKQGHDEKRISVRSRVVSDPLQAGLLYPKHFAVSIGGIGRIR